MAISRTGISLTDDSGDGTSGTLVNRAWFEHVLDHIDALVTDVTTYTPTWTSTGTAPAIGNGTLTGRWQRVNGLVFFELELTFGTTTTPGTGTWSFSLPTTAAAARGRGMAALMDADVRYYGAFWLLSSTTTLTVYSDTGSAVALIGAGAPFTWASTDWVKLSGFYVEA